MNPWILARIVLVVALVFPLAAAAASDEQQGGEGRRVNHGEAQVEWLRSRGGYFNPKLAFHPPSKNSHDDRGTEKEDGDDGPQTALQGVFATERVFENETLMTIPRRCLLTSGGSYNVCDTARRLHHEMELFRRGLTSEFAPYIHYLSDLPSGQIPTAWSAAGQELFVEVRSEELPPMEVAERSFDIECWEGDDPAAAASLETAYSLLVQRSWDDILVPVLDMMNHRNSGRHTQWHNVDSTSIHDETRDKIRVFARRDIEAGEQLYLSYNECADCHDIALQYGLQDIFRDYGFVEQYPQRWMFHEVNFVRRLEHVVFEIDTKDGSQLSSEDGNKNKPEEPPGAKELQLTWLSDAKPNLFMINFFRGHLKRLQGIKDTVLERAEHLVSDHERDAILGFLSGIDHSTGACDLVCGGWARRRPATTRVYTLHPR